MVDKRGPEAENGSEAKRLKAGGTASLPNMDAIAKARALLEKQKALQEKFKKLPQLANLGPGQAATQAAASANPLNPAGAADPAAVAAAAARAVEVAARLGLTASIAPRPIIDPATAAGLAAPTAASVGGVRPPLSGVRPLAARPPLVLRLDAQGREVDEHGRPVVAPPPVASSLVNQRRPEAASTAEQPPPEPEGPADEDFVDPSLQTGAGRRLQRRPRGFDFVEEGTFQKQAEMMRLRQKYGEAAFRKMSRPRGPVGPSEDPNRVPLGPPPTGPPGGPAGEVSDANLVPIGQQPVELSELEQLQRELPECRDPLPAVEWWDKQLLEGGLYYQPRAGQQQQQQGEEGREQATGSQEQQIDASLDPEAGDMHIRTGKITLYVEHPVPIEPPAEAPAPPPRPVMLTKKELKKLRTQRRQAREKEKQELLRQGLLEPPKPKIKISNMYRVLTEAAVDPTAIEQRVRGEMQERAAAHEDRNLARMLTPAERRDKKLRKMFDDTGREVITAVYRVQNLSNGKHRYQVDINVRENQMSGIMLLLPQPSFSLVVVEGCAKSIKRLRKLMLRRIDWNAKPLPPRDAGAGGEEAAAAEGAEEEEEDEQEPNSCYCVWEGVVKSAAFKDFVREEVATPAAARHLLDALEVAHYWDAAQNWDPDAAPLVEV